MLSRFVSSQEFFFSLYKRCLCESSWQDVYLMFYMFLNVWLFSCLKIQPPWHCLLNSLARLARSFTSQSAHVSCPSSLLKARPIQFEHSGGGCEWRELFLTVYLVALPFLRSHSLSLYCAPVLPFSACLSTYCGVIASADLTVKATGSATTI